MRIGGEFELDVSMLVCDRVGSPPDLPCQYKIWVDTGRSALLLALGEIVKRGGIKEAWLPAYICSSVIAPFLELGFSLHFFSLGGNLRHQAMPLPQPGGTILFAHYFGIKNTAAVEWIKEQRQTHQFYVIEDCVQASLNLNVGEVGDFVITSYRKYLPQPDGALLGSRQKLRCKVERADEEFISAKLVGKMIRNTSRKESLFLQLLGDAELRLESSQPRKMSWISQYLMERTDISKVALVRRANWRRLHQCGERIGLLEHVVPLFDGLAEGDVPLGMPVRITNGQRDGLRNFLAVQHIYCPVHWPLSHLVSDDQEYVDDIALSRQILTLPIDQRLGKTHIEYITRVILTYFEQVKS